MEKACSDAASLIPADPREDELARDCESATDHHADEREDIGELRCDQHRQNGWIAARLANLVSRSPATNPRNAATCIRL
jgi:hypothetical protein